MAVRGKTAHYKLSEIQRRHCEALAKRSAVDGAWNAMQDMTHRLDAALTAVEQCLSADFLRRSQWLCQLKTELTDKEILTQKSAFPDSARGELQTTYIELLEHDFRGQFAKKSFCVLFIFLGMDDEKNCICYFDFGFIHRVCIRKNGKQRGFRKGQAVCTARVWQFRPLYLPR
jgi:hypothetical protein